MSWIMHFLNRLSLRYYFHFWMICIKSAASCTSPPSPLQPNWPNRFEVNPALFAHHPWPQPYFIYWIDNSVAGICNQIFILICCYYCLKIFDSSTIDFLRYLSCCFLILYWCLRKWKFLHLNETKNLSWKCKNVTTTRLARYLWTLRGHLQSWRW